MHDQYDDKSLVTLTKIANVIELPAFVKEASVADEKNIANLPRRSFADSLNKKFPIATKEDAYLSSVYFSKNASEYENAELREEVKDKLDKALTFWGIDKKATIIKHQPTIEKKAGATEALRVMNSNKESVDAWELNSPRDFEKAAIQLFDNKNMFTFEQRKDLAEQMKKSAFYKEASLSDDVVVYLDKAAGEAASSKKHIVKIIKQRAGLYKQARHTDYAQLLANHVEETLDELDTGFNIDKIASVLDFMDKTAGIDHPESAEESLYEMTYKQASEAVDGYVQLMNGSTIKKSDVSESSIDEFFDKYAGETLSGSFEDKLDVLASLPEPDADDFEKYYIKG